MPAEAAPAPVAATLAEAGRLIGQPLGPSPWRVVTQDEVTRFCSLTGDLNPVHVDPGFARTTPLGRTTVPGYYTLALAVPLMSEVLRFADAAGAVNYGLDKVRFTAPVPVGSRLRLRAVLTAATDIANGIQAHFTSTFELENSVKPAAVAETILRFHRR